MSVIKKKLLLSLISRLTPTTTSKDEISSDEIDQVPLPKFPTEVPIKTTFGVAEPARPPPPINPYVPTLQTLVTHTSISADKSADQISLSDPTLQISDRFGANSIESEYVSARGVLKDGVLKAVKEAAHVSRSVPFEIFNRKHLDACQGLIEVLYYIDEDNLATAIDYAKPFVNEELLNYCINVVARHRDDFIENDIQLPSHFTTHPSTYVDVSKIESILYSRAVRQNTTTEPIEIESYHDFTATNADPEHFVAYFREDVGINLHHRHWHEVYPTSGPRAICDLDRRGELFVYMHGQILARYNFERLCNGLDPVKKFSNFKEPIMEAYYPKLDEASEVKVWSPRQPHAQLRDISRDGFMCEVIDMERWLQRIISAIDRGYAIKLLPVKWRRSIIKMEEPNAINDLGNTIDAVPGLSYNYPYYGDLHTNGHIIISYCHDPDKRFKEPSGVMGRLEAALRDPMFYRWHAFVDDVMERYKKKLQKYTLAQRLFQNIEIESVEIENGAGEKNVINTCWQQDRVDVTNGILSLNEHVNLKKRPETVFVKFTHLQHKDFTYKFRVNSFRSNPVTGVVRVFMAPKYDETKREMNFNKLRRFMIELDKFTVLLKKGKNEFTRKSTCSSVTVPFEQTFLTSAQAEYVFATDEQKKEARMSYCGCGLPHHLLIGRGRKTGYACTLFAMITNYDEDKVEDSSIESCGKSSISYCGVRNKKYPDKRPMGFPFDRPIRDEEANLDVFMTEAQSAKEPVENVKKVKNMYKTEFVVKFKDEVIKGPTCAGGSQESGKVGAERPTQVLQGKGGKRERFD